MLKRRLLIKALYNRDDKAVFSVSKGCIRIVARLVSFEEAESRVPFLVGVTVAKRVGPAVVRNRIKRLMRESFRTHQHIIHALGLSRCMTLMLLYRGSTDQIPDISDDLPDALEKLPESIQSLFSN